MNDTMASLREAWTSPPLGRATVGSFPEGVVGHVKDHEDGLAFVEKKMEGYQELLQELQGSMVEKHECGLEGAEAPSPEVPCFASLEVYASHARDFHLLRPPLHEHHHDPRAYLAPSPHACAHAHDILIAHVTGS